MNTTPITLINPFNGQLLHYKEGGLEDDTGIFFPLKNGAYRFVNDKNYSDNFGFQWNKFRLTQIDKTANFELSRQRFFVQTAWDKEDLVNKNILEVGSGAGRFTQVLLDHTVATVHSVDYSNAVEANYKNNGPHPRLHLYQASIYEMPFAPSQFDKVFCFGVLQHTPDVKKSVQSLIAMAKPGAEVIVDFYFISGWWTKVHAKYLLRPFTKKMDHQRLYSMIDRNAGWLIKTSRFFSKIGLGSIMNRFIPICDIEGTLPRNLSEKQLHEMVVLDTFDMFSPEYDQPQHIGTVVKWFTENGMKDVWGGFVKYDHFRGAVVKGIKK
ncbi:MAG TPA: class I SAM-dependent methyltransferase [Ferruginibacter sp.]|nr:class I SAM-dependent methyltransferase [Ferruginibacter sp.]